MDIFLQQLINGVTLGSVYALVALGYTMVYGIIGLINFAHGEVVMIGAKVSLSVVTALLGAQVPLPFFAIVLAGLLVAIAVCMAIAFGMERIAYRPLRKAPRLAPLITAIGMSFVLEGVMFLWHGPASVHFPDILPHGRNFQATINGVFVTFKDGFVMVTAIVLVTLLAIFINRTKLGKAMRATAQDRDAAQLMGIDINRTIAATFFIGALLAGAGGMIWGLYFNNLFYNLGFRTGLVAFTSAVFGGIGNIPGAAIGGVLIGLIAAYSDSYIGSKWTEVVIFGILIGVLVFRPTGLLGMRVPEK